MLYPKVVLAREAFRIGIPSETREMEVRGVTYSTRQGLPERISGDALSIFATEIDSRRRRVENSIDITVSGDGFPIGSCTRGYYNRSYFQPPRAPQR